MTENRPTFQGEMDAGAGCVKSSLVVGGYDELEVLSPHKPTIDQETIGILANAEPGLPVECVSVTETLRQTPSNGVASSVAPKKDSSSGGSSYCSSSLSSRTKDEIKLTKKNKIWKRVVKFTKKSDKKEKGKLKTYEKSKPKKEKTHKNRENGLETVRANRSEGMKAFKRYWIQNFDKLPEDVNHVSCLDGYPELEPVHDSGRKKLKMQVPKSGIDSHIAVVNEEVVIADGVENRGSRVSVAHEGSRKHMLDGRPQPPSPSFPHRAPQPKTTPAYPLPRTLLPSCQGPNHSRTRHRSPSRIQTGCSQSSSTKNDSLRTHKGLGHHCTSNQPSSSGHCSRGTSSSHLPDVKNIAPALTDSVHSLQYPPPPPVTGNYQAIQFNSTTMDYGLVTEEVSMSRLSLDQRIRLELGDNWTAKEPPAPPPPPPPPMTQFEMHFCNQQLDPAYWYSGSGQNLNCPAVVSHPPPTIRPTSSVVQVGDALRAVHPLVPPRSKVRRRRRKVRFRKDRSPPPPPTTEPPPIAYLDISCLPPGYGFVEVNSLGELDQAYYL